MYRIALQGFKFRPMKNSDQITRQAAHDIRSPLTALKALVNATELSQEQAQMIRAVIGRMEQIAEDLCQKQSATPDIAPLAQAIKSLVMEKKWEHPKIQFKIEIDPSAQDEIHSTKELKRVISNLVNNSVQSGAKNICIEIKKINKKLSLALSDDGSGMPDDVVASINMDTSLSSSKFGGHGLGLRHARNFAKEGKGFLKVFSKIGRGTHIRIENLVGLV